MENQSGDGSQVEESLVVESTELKSSDVNNEITGCRGVNIFQYFHNKYYDYKLMLNSKILQNDGNEKSNFDHESVLILQSMIQDLDDEIKKIDDKDNNFLRFLSMKIFLHHDIVKSLKDSHALDILERVITESKLYILEPQVVYSAFLAMNFIASIKHKKRDPISLLRAKEILENCQEIDKIMNSVNKDNRYYTSKELFCQDQEMPVSSEATMKYEKLVTNNLLLLGSVYQELNDHYKNIVCYHTAFERMLNKGLVSPCKWVDFTTRLACVFIDDNNFKDARHHLAAATHVHEILEAKNLTIGDATKKDLMRSNSIHLALAWVRYCILLFEKSKDEDRKKFAILFKNGYPFLNPSYSSAKKSYSLNEEYNKPVTTEEKLFQNANFIESINKEIVDEFSGILNENCVSFGNFFNEIMTGQHKDHKNKETDDLHVAEKISIDKRNQNDENACKIMDNTDGKPEKLSVGIKELSVVQKKIETAEDNLRKEGKEEIKYIVNDKSEKEIGNTENRTEENEIDEKTSKKDVHLLKETDENDMKFTSLGYLPLEYTVPKDIIQSPDEAKQLFKFAYSWSRRAQTYYPRNADYYSYVNVILNMVSLYRLCAYFQGRDNLAYRISLEQTRESLLEHLVSELNEVQPESHLHIRLYQEMALLNVDLAMLNMCNIHNTCADETYKLCALNEVQFHMNHVHIVGDVLKKSSKMFNKNDKDMKDCEEQNITTSNSDKLEANI